MQSCDEMNKRLPSLLLRPNAETLPLRGLLISHFLAFFDIGLDAGRPLIASHMLQNGALTSSWRITTSNLVPTCRVEDRTAPCLGNEVY